MKKYLKISLSIVLASFLVTGCNKDFKDEIDIGNTYTHTLAFTSESVDADEAGSAVTLTVSLIGVARSTDVTIEYTLAESGMTEGTGYNFVGSKALVIPAGQYSASLTIEPIDNGDFNPDPQLLTFRMTSSSDGTLSLGSETAAGRSAVVRIIDNDCPFSMADWVGTYTVTEAFTTVNDPFGFSDFFGESYQIELAAVASDPLGYTATLSNSAGFNTLLPDGTEIVFQTCPKTIVFTAGDFTVAEFTTLSVQSTSFGNGEIRVDGDSNGYGLYGFTLTKQ